MTHRRAVQWTFVASCTLAVAAAALLWALHPAPRWPDAVAAVTWCVLIGLVLWRFTRTVRTQRGYKPWQCAACGSPLLRLSRGRCPQCGRKVD